MLIHFKHADEPKQPSAGDRTAGPRRLERAREKGERSGLRPSPMVASDHTTMKEVAAKARAPALITQGLPTHLYIISWGCIGLAPAIRTARCKL